MVASKEIDAVAVVVRVPLHHEPTKAAIEAASMSTEWPLGRTTAEAKSRRRWPALRECRLHAD
jgi:predicted dehydrogenase